MAVAAPTARPDPLHRRRANHWNWLRGQRAGRLLALGVATAALLILHLGPALHGLKPQAQTIVGIFLWFIIVLATEALPQVIVGVAAPLLAVVLNGTPVPKAFNAFNSDVFFLILSAFVLVAVMIGTGLGKRVAFGVVHVVHSTRASRILGAMAVAATLLHAILPTVSETALFLPISRCLGDLSEGQEPPPALKRANQAVILTITGLVPLFASVLFLTAGVPNLVLTALLGKNSGIQINWLDWFVYNLPLWGLIPITYLLVRWWFKLGPVELPDAEQTLVRVRAELGPISKREIWVLVCIGVGFTLWVTEPLIGISTGMAALIMVGLLFMPWSGLRFTDFGGEIMWQLLFLIAGAISMGNLLFSSGAVTWLSHFVVAPIQHSGLHNGILVLFILAFALHVARAGIISGGAMAAVFVPLSIGIAKQLDFNVLPFALILTNAMNFAVFVPISAVAVLIAVQAAELRWREMIAFGSLLSVIANVYLIFTQSAWMALLGHPLRG